MNYATYYEKLGQKYTDEWAKEAKKYEAAGIATGKFYTDKYAKLYGNAPEKDDLMNLLSRFSLQNLVSDVEKNV